MIQTIIVYISIIIVLIIFCSDRTVLKIKLSHKLSYDVSFILGILLVSIVFGMRYGVGVDHLTYLQHYEWYQLGKWWMLDYRLDEPGYVFISRFFADLGFHYSVNFTFWCFIQFFFLFYAIKRNNSRVLPFLAITFICSSVALSFMNGIRQQLAVCIFVFAVEFIVKRKLWYYFIFVGFATLFHYSAVILFPIYFIINWKKKGWFNSVSLQLALLIVCLVLLFVNYQKEIFTFIVSLLEDTLYSSYANALTTRQNLLFSLKRPRGLGFILTLIMNLYFIIQSKTLKQYYRSKYVNVVYDLFVIGTLYGYLSNGSIMLQRPNYYFSIFQIVIGALYLNYLYNNTRYSRNNIVYFSMLFSFYLLLFAAIIMRMDESSYRFIFFFQEHLFYLKEAFDRVITS